MKKHIFSVLMAAMAAFTFSSCEDVPEPYTQPERPEQGETTTGEPKGTGTAEDPYNCAAAIQYCQSLDGAESTNDVYVKGKVQSIEEQFSSNYGNVSVTLVDEDGSTTFKIWRAYYFDNKKWTTGGKEVAIGDELVFCGKVVNYSGNTPETVQGKAWLVSINGENGSGSTTPDTPATGKGSESDPYTVTEAIEAIKAGAPTTEVYLTGIVSEVSYYNETYKSITYYISDTGKSNDMQVYSGKGLNGADFTSKDDLKAGQKVTIKGFIKKYTDKNGNDIMEVDKTSSIIKIENGGGSVDPTPTPSGNGKITFADDHKTLTLENSTATSGESVSFDFTAQGYENQTAMETITLPDGTTITFEANGETNGPKYYTSGTAVRVYKNNKIIVTGSKAIAKIIFNCNSPYTSKGETVNCDGNETATITFSGKTATYTNVFTGSTGGGVQLRFQSIKIVYAK